MRTSREDAKSSNREVFMSLSHFISLITSKFINLLIGGFKAAEPGRRV
jgi:hypothetical protein